MNDDIKLLTPQEPVQQFPKLNISFTPDGNVVLVIQLGPLTSIMQVIQGADMDVLCMQWEQAKNEIRGMRELAVEVLRTKNRETR